MNIDDFFRQATLCICSSLDNTVILSRCRSFLRDYMPVDAISMDFYDRETQTFETIGMDQSPEFPAMDRHVTISGEAVERVESIDNSRIFLHVNNRPRETPVGRFFWEAMGRADSSVITMGLALDSQGIGIVTITALGEDRYTPEHSRLFGLLHDPFALAMANTRTHRELLRLQELLKDDNRYLKKQLHRLSGDEIIGANRGLANVMEMVRQVSPLSSQVLLLGETGVGKEVIANAIHHASPRANGPFIKINCGAIPENLIDSELFGHEKGAFTGATTLKRGRFERAHNGTLFLDEIGELPLQAQVRLLRVLQTREIERVGGTAPVKVDVRIIAATHRDLEGMVQAGRFREDLWYRTNVFPITIPPLRERLEDMSALVQYFIDKKGREMNFKTLPVPAPGSVEILKSRSWSGNIRELENTVERAMIKALDAPDNAVLHFGASPAPPAVASPVPSTPDPVELCSLDRAVTRHIQAALDACNGKVQGADGAAALLGLNPSTLRNKMKKLGIPYGRKSKVPPLTFPPSPGPAIENPMDSRYE
ncbi:MAG: sigma 54-interacting transcriptional regulator [Desulfobacterales bacterium]|nr:sigma 54-interacting transcriptional regulator [Desulfobacterales bacterium]